MQTNTKSRKNHIESLIYTRLHVQYTHVACHNVMWREFEQQLRNGVRSGQVVILKARPAMDAAVMFFHLSLSPTSSSSPTRFRPVVMPYNDKLALFNSFLSTVALGVQQVVFLLASIYELWMATTLCSFW